MAWKRSSLVKRSKPSSARYSCVMMGKLLNLSEPQFPHLQNGEEPFIHAFIQNIYEESTDYTSLHLWSSEPNWRHSRRKEIIIQS